MKYYIFDYGATIDTPGTHWGKLMWHAYERLTDLTEEQFREAYVFAERYLGSHDIIKPSDTFYTTLQTKIRLQLGFLHSSTSLTSLTSFNSPSLSETLLQQLYSAARQNVADSKVVLEELKRRGKTLGLVSNFYGNISAVLEEFGLSSLFTAVVESATEGIRKPDPRLLQLCMERINATAQDTVVIGDHLTKDIQPAKQLGCSAVWIKGEPWSNEHDALETVRPDRVITSLTELL